MDDRAFAEALERLFRARRAGIDFGLERMRAACERLGIDVVADRAVQIAGTNGKGSTSAFVESIALEAGLRVGVFSSPHLLSICERFRIQGQPIARDVFCQALAKVESLGETFPFFEAVTLMAALIFADAHLDLVIWEVGLGGRLDATTAMHADVSAVTGIGIDHTEFLGDTLEAIAREKAGVARAGADFVIGLSAPETIRELLWAEAREAGAFAVLVGENGEVERVPPNLALRGEHQRANAACAIAIVDALAGMGCDISEKHVEKGLVRAQLAGRFQRLREAGDGLGELWIDGAHNGQAARELAKTLAAEGREMAVVVGISREKDLGEILGPLLPHAMRVVLSQGRSERAAPAEELLRLYETGRASFDVRKGLEVSAEPSLQRAIDTARAAGGATLVTGSLLLLGDVLALLGEGQPDPLQVTDPSTRRLS